MSKRDQQDGYDSAAAASRGRGLSGSAHRAAESKHSNQAARAEDQSTKDFHRGAADYHSEQDRGGR